MPLIAKENYLKTMYLIEEESGSISLSELARRLNVSIPTTNSMVKRLQEEGLTIYEKYKPSKLTKKGKKEAALIVRKHRIAEMFLVEKLNFGWEEVHDIAEEMEHVQSETFFDRMYELLDAPAFSPHGSPIPDKNGVIVLPHYLKLSDAQQGDKLILKALQHDYNDLLSYLNSKELELGTHITVNKVEAFDNSMAVSYNDKTNVNLSQQVCEKLLVIPLPAD